MNRLSVAMIVGWVVTFGAGLVAGLAVAERSEKSSESTYAHTERTR